MDSYDIAVRKTSEELGVPITVVRQCYNEFWRFIKEKIESLPLTEEMVSEDDFNKMDTVFNVPSLCKVYCTYEQYVKKKESIQKRKKHNV